MKKVCDYSPTAIRAHIDAILSDGVPRTFAQIKAAILVRDPSLKDAPKNVLHGVGYQHLERYTPGYRIYAGRPHYRRTVKDGSIYFALAGCSAAEGEASVSS